MANNENEFENEPLGEDFDHDFGEFDAEQDRGSIGSVWKSSPVVKFGLIGAAILVVVAAVALFGGKKEDALGSRVAGGATELKEAPGTSEVTPVMRSALEEKNQQNLEDALKTGSSNIPTPIEPPKVLLGVPEKETATEDPLVRWKKMQEERVKLQRQQEKYVAQSQADPQQQERINSLRQAMVAHFQQIMEKNGIPQMQHMMVTNLDALQRAGGTGAQYGGAAGAAGQTAGVSDEDKTPVKVILPAGDIVYSQLLIEANSDVKGPIVAMIVSGPFNGSRVIGSFQKQEEYLVMQFNTLVTKDGHSVAISATAIDPDTTLTGMATDVDHRYWKRIILPAAAKFVEGFGNAIAESGTDVVVVDGAAVQSQNDLNTKEELAKAGGEAFTKVSEILDEEGNETEILVKVRAGTPMGLLFTQSVTEDQLDAAKYGPSTVQGQQAANPNAVNNNGIDPQTGLPLNSIQALQQGLTALQTSQQQGAVPPAPQVTYSNGLQ